MKKKIWFSSPQNWKRFFFCCEEKYLVFCFGVRFWNGGHAGGVVVRRERKQRKGEKNRESVTIRWNFFDFFFLLLRLPLFVCLCGSLFLFFFWFRARVGLWFGLSCSWRGGVSKISSLDFFFFCLFQLPTGFRFWWFWCCLEDFAFTDNWKFETHYLFYKWSKCALLFLLILW